MKNTEDVVHVSVEGEKVKTIIHRDNQTVMAKVKKNTKNVRKCEQGCRKVCHDHNVIIGGKQNKSVILITKEA